MRSALLLLLAACSTSPVPQLPPPVVLTVSAVIPGQPMTFDVEGANPGERIFVGVGTGGVGAGPCPPTLGGACLSIRNPIPLLSGNADASGARTFTAVVPASLPPGRALGFQAASLGSPIALSPAVPATVQDPAGESVCDDGDDNDFDGLADCMDPDCGCITSCVVDLAPAITTRQPQSPTVTADDGSDLTAQVTWSSSDDALASVWGSGVVQPVSPGTVTLTAALPSGIACSADTTITAATALPGDVVLNELLADVDGDPNGDGTSSAVDDEFIEVLNIGTATVSLAGVAVFESDFPASARHTFSSDTLLRAGESIVVFAGGDTSSLSSPSSVFETAQNNDPGIPFGLNLNDGGDRVRLLAADGSTLDDVAYGSADLTGTVPAPVGVSISRSPDGSGAFATHPALPHSPGAQLNGTDFQGYEAVYEALYAP